MPRLGTPCEINIDSKWILRRKRDGSLKAEMQSNEVKKGEMPGVTKWDCIMRKGSFILHMVVNKFSFC